MPLLPVFCLQSAAAQGPATLRGTVADSLSGQPLAGVSVGLQGQPGGTATDALGKFRLSGVPAGTYTLRVGALGYRAHTLPVTLAAGETRTLNAHRGGQLPQPGGGDREPAPRPQPEPGRHLAHRPSCCGP